MFLLHLFELIHADEASGARASMVAIAAFFSLTK